MLDAVGPPNHPRNAARSVPAKMRERRRFLARTGSVGVTQTATAVTSFSRLFSCYHAYDTLRPSTIRGLGTAWRIVAQAPRTTVTPFSFFSES